MSEFVSAKYNWPTKDTPLDIFLLFFRERLLLMVCMDDVDEGITKF